MGLYLGGLYMGGKEKHLNLQYVKVESYPYTRKYGSEKACILAYCTLHKMWNTFKVKIKDTRIHKVNNKDTVDVILVSLLLTLDTFHFLLQFFYCWLWPVVAGVVACCSDTLCLLKSIEAKLIPAEKLGK